MKTKSLFFATLMLMVAVVPVLAKDEPVTKGMAIIQVKGSEVYKVIYKGEAAGKVKLAIYDQSGRQIMTETFNGVDGFICPLNFKGLESGEYTVELTDATGKRTEKVYYKTEINRAAVHVNQVDGENGKYLLSVANVNSNEEITVKIFDGQDRVIHTETKNVNADFALVYKLADAADNYTFEVSDSAGRIKIISF